MKLSIILLFTISFFSVKLSAQTAFHFQDAASYGAEVSKLDSLYKSGLHSDSTLAVFHRQQDEYLQAYQKLLADLGKYLKQNGFTWQQNTRGFNRIYFNADGKIDYFLYNFRPNQLNAEEETRFGQLLHQFIWDYQFPLRANVGFAQCSPVVYQPIQD
jgi:hypothetical protein